MTIFRNLSFVGTNVNTSLNYSADTTGNLILEAAGTALFTSNVSVTTSLMSQTGANYFQASFVRGA